MVRLEWDATGKLLQVTVQEDKPFDGKLAQEVLTRLEELMRGQERILLLVDGRALRRGTLDWTMRLVTFLLTNRSRLRIAIYGAGSTLDGLEGWAQSSDMEVAAFRTRDEAGRWLIAGERRRGLGDQDPLSFAGGVPAAEAPV